MIAIKSDQELNIIRDGGKILAEIVEELKKQIVVGSSPVEIDQYAAFLCKRFGVKPAFLGYNGFKGVICANLNEVVVHGLASTIDRKFVSGDIFGLDMGIIYRGFYLDMSYTVTVGEVSEEIKQFLAKTYKSMDAGIKAVVPGNTVGDISFAMRDGFVSPKFSLMRDFIGHGVGRHLHEKPDIPALGMNRGEGDVLKPGMVVAIESISVLGPSNDYYVDKKDKWTVYTKNKEYLSGLYEHTVIITKDGPEIVTMV